MCGIFGYFGEELHLNVLGSLFDKGKKRGPEESKLLHINKYNKVGFHRLAINGLNKESSQPIYLKKYILVANGEIFNYKQLIEKYNFTMKTQSDCEIILHLYDKFGTSGFKELDGEYAFILFNCDNNNIIICRDPFGVRPLYLYNNNNVLLTSSVLSSMIHDNFISNHIEQFKPGTYSIYKYSEDTNNIEELEKYVNYTNVYENYTPEEINYDRLYELLKESVYKRITTSERPVCCLLSGGLDSSIVSAISSEYYRSINKTLETFSIGMKDSADYYYAKKVSDFIGSKHTHVEYDEQTFIDSIPQVIKDIESYDTTTVRASVGNWLIGKYIKENTDFKVILNGDGADELMGGYLYFNAAPNNEEFDEECRRLLKNIHYFDVLRSDRCISSHGLESRTPFLDKDLTRYYLNIPMNTSGKRGKCEKEYIRSAISQKNILPYEIVWRQKEAFSDGVSGLKRPWFQMIHDNLKEYETKHDNLTNEQAYYFDIFNSLYPGCNHLIPYYWMPMFIESNDPSARTLKLYQRNIFYEYFYFLKDLVIGVAKTLYRKYFM